MPSPTKRSSLSPTRRSVLSPKTSNIASPFKKSSVVNPFTNQSPVVPQQQNKTKRPKLAFTIFEDKIEAPIEPVLEAPTSNKLTQRDQENILQPIPEVIRSGRMPLRNLSIIDYPAELHVPGQETTPLSELYEPITFTAGTSRELSVAPTVRYKYTNVPSFVTPSRRSCRYLVHSAMDDEESILLKKVRKPKHKRSLSLGGIRKSNFTILSA